MSLIIEANSFSSSVVLNRLDRVLSLSRICCFSSSARSFFPASIAFLNFLNSSAMIGTATRAALIVAIIPVAAND